MLARLKFDLQHLVNEILDLLPEDIVINGRFLDPAMGGGQFVREIERRKRQAGKTDQEIAESVFGLEENILRRDYAVNRFNLVGTYQIGKFLEMDDSMKFDVIIGNPPFQKTVSKSKRWTLWEEFVKKSLATADQVAMITPQSITSPGPFNLIKGKADVINVNIGQHFNVGSTFCYFITNPNKKKGSKTRIRSSAGDFDLDVSRLPFLPFVIDAETIDQIHYLMKRQSRRWKRGELHTSKSALFTEKGRYPVMHTNAQELRTNTNHPNLTKIRVAVSLSGYPQFRVIQDSYVSQACFWTEFSSREEAEEFAKECNGEYIQKIMSVFKWSGWNSKEVIQCL